MSLEDHFNKIVPSPTRCKTCIWYEQQSPADQAFFDEKSADPHLNYAKLWEACRRNGLDAVCTSFRDHINNNHAARFVLNRSC